MAVSLRLSPRLRLNALARRAMQARGFAPEFSHEALAEVAALPPAGAPIPFAAHDLRTLPWCSIDNDDSHDLDQLTVSEHLADGATRIRVAIADVAALIPIDSALDAHARLNTTSVYTAAHVFPMLPERLSTDLTSLNVGVDRLAVVVDMTFSATTVLIDSEIYPAVVRNHAQLAYSELAEWLDGSAPVPASVHGVEGLAGTLKTQHRVAVQLAARRHQRGALSLETTQTRPLFDGTLLVGLECDRPNSAKRLIEDLMVAANGVTARFLSAHQVPSLRRVVRTPKSWDRLLALADANGFLLPALPDASALEAFLVARRAADPARFPELSLSVIKLLGPGEYVVELPGEAAIGHFALAVKDYAHSTAPNRRFPDVITQRLLKAVLAGRPSPYSIESLTALARHCTQQEDAARKVERQVEKSAAAMLLTNRIGDGFDAIVTGAGEHGCWVRISAPPVEGKLDHAATSLQIGTRLRVTLASTDVDRGFIDFVAA